MSAIYDKRDIPADLQQYFVRAEIGLESTPDEFIGKLVAVFREVKRVLRDDGTLWVNIGDSYAANRGYQVPDSKVGYVGNEKPARVPDGLKAKDLIGIPWMLAFALRADGWYLRQDIIWSKPNPMPESVTDRCTRAHEYIFMLSKSARYYYDQDAIKVPGLNPEDDLRRLAQQKGENKSAPDEKQNGLRPRTDKQRGHSRRHEGFNERWYAMERTQQCAGMVNKRSVWNVATKPFSEAHFATFPPDLIEPAILAGSPVGGYVLDPFGGAGTTGLVCDRLQRNAILCELNPAYAEMARKRIFNDSPLFAEVA